MEKLVFKYDVMYIAENKYEIRRFKKKPFFDILFYMFSSGFIYALIIPPVILSLMFHLSGTHIFWYTYTVPPVIPFCMFTVNLYYQHHKNADITADRIKKIRTGKKTLRIEYCDDNNKFRRVKIIDLPRNQIEREQVLRQMQEANIPANFDNCFSPLTAPEKLRFYKFNLYALTVSFCISLIFLFVVLNLPPVQYFIVWSLLFVILFCGFGALYCFYKLKKLSAS